MQSRGYHVSEDYFDAMKIGLQSGRMLGEHDDDGAERVVVINQRVADTLFSGENPLGKRLQYGDEKFTVVGVVNTVKHLDPTERPTYGNIYFHYKQSAMHRTAIFTIKTSGEAAALTQSVRQVFAEIDPRLPRFQMTSMENLLAELFARREGMIVMILKIASGLAVLLACLGIYGLLSFFVSQRTREIGIRMALGAPISTIIRMILVEGAKYTGTGVVVGGLAAWTVGQLARGMFFGVNPNAAGTYFLIAAGLFAIGLLACALPVIRATHVRPIDILK
jgi:putative ABC transport system permease protein